MRRVAPWIAVVGVLLWLAPPTWAAGPRFQFTAGQVLTYSISLSGEEKDASGTFQQVLHGKAILRVVKVKPEGTAEVILTTSGQGQLAMGSETFALADDGATSVVLTVKPNGAITEIKNSDGQPFSLFTNDDSLVSGSGSVRRQLIMTYTLFGLQLPSVVPAVGKKWTGYHKQEILAAASDTPAADDMTTADDAATSIGTPADSGDLAPTKVEIQQVPITFFNKGTKQYQGRSCLVISFNEVEAQHGTPIPITIFFDTGQGQLVGVEQHAKDDQGKMDLVVQLIPNEKEEEAAPAEEEDEEWLPVIK